MAIQVGAVIGQSKPVAATATKLYTVPAGNYVISSSLVCNNQSQAVKDEIKVSVRIAGAADSAEQYLIGDAASANGLSMEINNPYIATIGLSLSAGDEIWVWSLNGTTSFNFFGVKFT